MSETCDRRVRELMHEYGSPVISVAELLCDRHDPESIAFTVVDADGAGRDLSFGTLADRSRRLAGALSALGVGPGDRVATLMTKSADLPVALLAIWRCGAVYVPLFTAFAAPAVALRLDAAEARVVIVDADQRGKLGASDRRIIVNGAANEPGDLELEATIASHGPLGASAAVGGAGPFIRLFTSGTTGDPKGVVIPVRALAAFVAYQEFGLDVTADDVFWNAADPGWAYGLYYAICAPLATGRRSLLLHAPFSPALTYHVLEKFGVTNFAAAPTVYRGLRNYALGKTQLFEGCLRRCSSAGEPLNADIVAWARETLGVPVHDQYGQTELGMAVINAHHPALAGQLKPGSMGRAMPGFSLAVLKLDGMDRAATNEVGRVAVDKHASPLMWFDGYAEGPPFDRLRVTEVSSPTFELSSSNSAARPPIVTLSPSKGGHLAAGERWYLTGDAGWMDEDGYLFFSARDDDVIIMAGYRIGPFEIESVLLEHDAVAEVAVVGMPDELRGEVVEAFVVVRAGVAASEELASELQRHVKERYAAHAYPRAVHFTTELPKTPSGKLQRYLLRASRATAE